MTTSSPEPFQRFRPHPWDGLDVGPDPPRVVCASIEIMPFDLIDYELDARVIGGLQLIDGRGADDKLIVVLENDDLWRSARADYAEQFCS